MRVIRFESIDSTNAEARRQASAGAAGACGSSGRADAGRGRRARLWVSEPGNLYASLLLRPDRAVSDLGGYALVAAIALHDAAVEAAPQLAWRVQLKWPNDLVCDAGKVAGILLESEADAAGRPVLVIGWGSTARTIPMPRTIHRRISRRLASRLLQRRCSRRLRALSRGGTSTGRAGAWQPSAMPGLRAHAGSARRSRCGLRSGR
ncbi:MAG: biotin--[acetyl-CoA-carboxylase] ligase [Rhodobiaceae bacterium]|nr:biotin--[acetyl-CoA-carboxylase] ligase [Rhodobiaceae bacterium]